MESMRQQRVGKLLQKELGDIFLLDSKNMPGLLVSVSEVRVSPDLGFAKIFLSIFPSDKGKDLIKNVQQNVKSIRFELGKRVAKQLRIIPDLAFYLDESLDYVEKIDNLLGKEKDTESTQE